MWLLKLSIHLLNITLSDLLLLAIEINENNVAPSPI